MEFQGQETFIKYFNSIISWIEVNEVTFWVYIIAVSFAILLIYWYILEYCLSLIGCRWVFCKKNKKQEYYGISTSEDKINSSSKGYFEIKEEKDGENEFKDEINIELIKQDLNQKDISKKNDEELLKVVNPDDISSKIPTEKKD